MADNSINPESQAKLSQFEQRLGGLEARLNKATAGIETAAEQVKGASSKVEADIGQKLSAPKAEATLTPETAKKSTAAADELAAAQRRATAAVEERIALEQRERALVGDIASAQARQGEAIAAKAAADRQLPVARADYRQAVTKGTPAETEAAARAQNDAKQQAQAANRDLAAANKLLRTHEQQLGVVRTQLDTARQLEASTAKEAKQAEERIALGSRLQAAMRARVAALEAEGGLGPPGGRYLGPSALGGGRLPPPPPPPPAPPGPPEGPGGRYLGPGATQYVPSRAPVDVTAAPTAEQLRAQREDEALKRKSAAASEKLASVNALAASSSRGLSAGMEAEARALSLTDQSLQKTNALHTDYLSALAKGQTTMRDFTSQMGLTIGKFAGWTGAAALVYGVIGAMQQLGRGAIEGLSGVSNLQRTVNDLNTGQASNQLIALSHDTVTPLKDASDAVFLFSRTFHNQNDAVYTAGLALRAYKLDGVSLVDQVKAMTAVHQQFKLSAQELGPVMGLLAQGQREYNARVTEMIPLLTPSVSAIKNAGGDLNEFIKVAQLALRTTQLTGPRLGTAFARSPGFAQKPDAQKTFEAFGIDPKLAFTNITELYREVLKKAISATGPERQQLSKALFGPLLGQRTAGLLAAGPDIQKQILGQNVTSAQPLLEEFSKYLKLPKTQLEALGVGLENLGARLANSGLLTGLGVVVHFLQLTLDTANAVLKVFDQLPAPIKDLVGLFAALRVGTAIASKLNVGANLGGNAPGTPSFSGALFPKHTARAQFTKALDEESGYYRDLAASSAKSSLKLKQQILTSEKILAEYQRSGASQELITAETNTLANLKVSQQRAIVAEEIAQKELVRVTEANAIGRAEIAKGAGLEEATLLSQRAQKGEVLGLQRPGPPGVKPTEVPLTTGPLLGPAAGVAFTQTAAQEKALSARLAALAAAARTVAAASTTATVEAKAVTEAEALLAGATAEETVALEQMAVEDGVAGASFTRLGIAGRAAAAGKAAASAGARIAGASLGAVRGLVNPTTIALIGLPVLIGAINGELTKLDDATKAVDAALKAPPSLSNVEHLVNALKQKSDAETSFLGRIVKGFKDAGHDIGKAVDGIDLADIGIGVGPSSHLPHAGGSKGGGGGFHINLIRGAEEALGIASLFDDAKKTRAEIEKGLGEELLKEIRAAKTSASQIAKGSQHPEQLTSEINALKTQAESSSYLKRLKAIDPAAAKLVLQSIDTEIYQIWYQREQLLLASQSRSGRPLTELERIIREGQTGSAGSTDQVAQLQGLTDHIKLYGGSRSDLRRAAELYVVITAQFAKSRDPKELAKVTAAQAALKDAIQTHVQSLEDDANAIVVPSVKAAGVAAHLAALHKKQGLLGKAQAVLRAETALVGQSVTNYAKTIGATDAEITAAQAALDLLNAAIAAGGDQVIHQLSKSPAFAGGKEGAASGTLKKLAGGTKAYLHSLKGKSDQVKAAQDAADAINAALKPLSDSLSHKQGTASNAAGASSTDPFANERLRREIAKAQSQDPVAQARSDIAQARSEAKVAKSTHDKLQSQLDLVNADNELSQALQGVAASRATLAASQTQDPVAKARAQLVGATQAAAAATRQGTAAENAALAAENDARAQLASDIEAATQSRYALAAAQTNDPVAQAQIQEAGANQAAADAQKRGLGAAAVNAARASAASAANAAASAIEAGVQSRYALAASATLDPIKQAVINLAGATQAAGDAERRGLGAAAINDALAKENSSRQALAQAYEAAAQSRYQLAESRTTDPVRKARIEYNAANEALTRAVKNDEGAAAINTAKATRNNARQALRDQRIQASEDTIQFDLSMGKIGTETAIHEYQALLRVHTLTKAKRREVLLAIKNLQDQTSGDNILNLGTIKLPTAFEVKRALLGTQSSTPINVTQHYSTSIQVTDTRSANAVGVVFDRYHRGTGKAVSRAVGQR